MDLQILTFGEDEDGVEFDPGMYVRPMAGSTDVFEPLVALASSLPNEDDTIWERQDDLSPVPTYPGGRPYEFGEYAQARSTDPEPGVYRALLSGIVNVRPNANAKLWEFAEQEIVPFEAGELSPGSYIEDDGKVWLVVKDGPTQLPSEASEVWTKIDTATNFFLPKNEWFEVGQYVHDEGSFF